MNKRAAKFAAQAGANEDLSNIRDLKAKPR